MVTFYGPLNEYTLLTHPLCNSGIDIPGGGGNFVCTEVCGHWIGKLTHPQTKAGPSINKNTPILRLFTTEID